MIAPSAGRPSAPVPSRPHVPLSRRTWPPRAVQLALGAWVVLTAFLWPHSRVQASLAVGAGSLTVIFTLVALRYSPIRLLLGLVGGWLIVGSFMPPSLPLTVVNNAVCGALITALSFFPSGDVPLLKRRTSVPRET